MRVNKWLSLLIVLVLSAVFGVPGMTQAQGPETHGLGLIPALETPPTLPRDLRVGGKLPPAVDNSALGLPPVGDQGVENSSVAWATTYYYKTFQEKQERGWDVLLPDHQFSPGMTYNMRTDYTPNPCTIDAGMRFPDALAILILDGALPLSQFPYDPADPCTQPSAEQLADAYLYRSLGYGAFFVYGEGGHVTDAQVENMKAHLYGGNLVLLGIPIYSPSFEHPEDNQDIVDVPGLDEKFRGYHAITLVGYDDAAAGGRGAFKFVNSWGPAYGGDGFAYLTYDFVKKYAREAWWMIDYVAPKGCIQGTVLDNQRQPVPDVTVVVEGPTPWTGTTDLYGQFQTGAVLALGTYTVTPDKAGYTFEPASAEVIVEGETCLTQDFVATLQPTQAVVYIEPSSQVLACGQVATLTVAIRDVVNFYGVQFHLTFDPTVIEIVDPDGDPSNGILVPGDIFPPDEFHIGTEVVDNVTGQVEYAITLLRVPKAPPFSGSGPLALITVRALAEGASPLVFLSAQTANGNGGAIEALTEDAVITVECATTLGGYAYLEGRPLPPAGDHSGILVTLEGSGLTALTDASGAYLFADVPAGTYTVMFTHEDFLATQVVNVVVLENEANVLCGYKLLAGDINNDGSVDILDLSLCAASFGTADPETDVNADGTINIYDLVLIGKNFKLTSPQPGLCVP